MAKHSPDFRDFGILLQGLQPPPEKIRSLISRAHVVFQYIIAGCGLTVGLVLMVLMAPTLPPRLSLFGCTATLVGFGTLLYLWTRNDYRWVELEGDILRAQHLYSRRTIERSVQEIEILATMVFQISRLETVLTEKLFGRVRGVEIRFFDGRTPLRIFRYDPAMANAKELIEAVLYRMAQIRELEAEIVNYEGRPFVRNIHWKGEQAKIPPGKIWKLGLCFLIVVALFLGATMGYGGVLEQERRLISSVPPGELTIDALIRNGPGANRYVTITDYRPGGYSVETKRGSWNRVWIALFPSREQPGQRREIKAVLLAQAVSDKAALHRLLQRGRITGICAETPRSKWGNVLGPNLIKANRGANLSAAWSVEEMNVPPSAGRITGFFAGSASCFAVALVLSAIALRLTLSRASNQDIHLARAPMGPARDSRRNV